MTPKGADDLDNIYRFVLEELFATSAATNILERIEKEIMRLGEFPFRAIMWVMNILEIKDIEN